MSGTPRADFTASCIECTLATNSNILLAVKNQDTPVSRHQLAGEHLLALLRRTAPRQPQILILLSYEAPQGIAA